ncbi:MAG: hypothetical protein SFU25_05200 [Candidatus Caenarcaniphilales bacterium]|nr:hypothetical protein [Candidatus Caenarcaniphilales bacterium]
MIIYSSQTSSLLQKIFHPQLIKRKNKFKSQIKSSIQEYKTHREESLLKLSDAVDELKIWPILISERISAVRRAATSVLGSYMFSPEYSDWEDPDTSKIIYNQETIKNTIEDINAAIKAFNMALPLEPELTIVTKEDKGRKRELEKLLEGLKTQLQKWQSKLSQAA